MNEPTKFTDQDKDTQIQRLGHALRVMSEKYSLKSEEAVQLKEANEFFKGVVQELNKWNFFWFALFLVIIPVCIWIGSKG